MEKYVPYRAYLIRIWETRRGGVAGCRAVAVDIATGERKDFPDLESLFTFLRKQGDPHPGESRRAYDIREEQ